MVFNGAMVRVPGDGSSGAVLDGGAAARAGGGTADPWTLVARVVRLAGVGSALVWALVALAWGEGPFALTYDDAYYYLEIAQRLADGQGSTFDGLNQTNGYHPLWLAITTLPFLGGLDGAAALRAVLVVQAVLWAATWWLIGGIVSQVAAGVGTVRDDRIDDGRRLVVAAAGGAAVLVAANPTIARIGISGLESALVLLAGAMVLAWVGTGSRRFIEGRTARWRVGLGALLALAVLSRTDHVLLVGAVALAMVFEPRAGRSPVEQARRAVPVIGVPAGVLAVYLLANQVVFGSAMQISGEIKRRPLTPALVVVALVVGAAVVLVVRAGSRRTAEQQDGSGRRSRLPRSAAFAASTAWYGAFCLGLVTYYLAFQTQRWLWYFAPPLLWGVVLLVLFLGDLVESALAEARETQSPLRATAPFFALLGAPLLIGLVVQWRQFTDPEIRSIQLANQRAGAWVTSELPPDAVLASWDAGVIGFFSEQPVVNLDGVVNSHEWLEANRQGPEAVRAFLDADGVGYIVNHGSIVDGDDPKILDYARRVYGDDRADRMELVESFPFTFSGTTVGSDGRESGVRVLSVKVYRIPPASG